MTAGRPAIGPKMQIRLRPDQVEALDREAEEETEATGVNVTRTTLIRRAVDEYLAD